MSSSTVVYLRFLLYLSFVLTVIVWLFPLFTTSLERVVVTLIGFVLSLFPVTVTYATCETFEPSVAVAVILTLPALIPRTFPLLSTVAIRGFSLTNDNVWFFASLGIIVAEILYESPTEIVLLLGVREI